MIFSRGISVLGSKMVRCFDIFISLPFDVNLDRNLNIEGSTEKLVALVLIKMVAKIK